MDNRARPVFTQASRPVGTQGARARGSVSFIAKYDLVLWFTVSPWFSVSQSIYCSRKYLKVLKMPSFLRYEIQARSQKSSAHPAARTQLSSVRPCPAPQSSDAVTAVPRETRTVSPWPSAPPPGHALLLRELVGGGGWGPDTHGRPSPCPSLDVPRAEGTLLARSPAHRSGSSSTSSLGPLLSEYGSIPLEGPTWSPTERQSEPRADALQGGSLVQPGRALQRSHAEHTAHS